MTDAVPPERIFPTSKVDAQAAKHVPSSPQTESEAYKLAFQDTDFLLRPDLRPVRFQLELLKPELLLDEAKIRSMLVFYGSARIPAPDMADALVAAASDDQERAVAERLKAKSQYYNVAYDLARRASRIGAADRGARARPTAAPTATGASPSGSTSSGAASNCPTATCPRVCASSATSPRWGRWTSCSARGLGRCLRAVSACWVGCSSFEA